MPGRSSEQGGLGLDHPAVRALNGLIASKVNDYRSAQWGLEESVGRVAAEGPRRIGKTSYEMPGSGFGDHYHAPTHELKRIAELAAEMLSLDRQIGELTRAKLSCFRDVDFHGGDFWIPTLVTGRVLDHRADYGSDLKTLLDTNPLPVTVVPVGTGFNAVMGERTVDALALFDLLTDLLPSGPDADPPAEKEAVPFNPATACFEDICVPPGILAVSGRRRPLYSAGEHAPAFYHTLRLALRSAAGAVKEEDD